MTEYINRGNGDFQVDRLKRNRAKRHDGRRETVACGNSRR